MCLCSVHVVNIPLPCLFLHAGYYCPGDTSSLNVERRSGAKIRRSGQRRQFQIEATAQLSCPSLKTSTPGSTSVSSCFCISGYYWWSDEGRCEVCPPNTFCTEGRSFSCPSDSQAPEGSVQIADCVCKEGYYGENGGTCTLCGPNQFCQGGNSYSCPDNSASAGGAGACTCEEGFFGPEGGPCALCPAGSYCSGGASETCPSQGTSQPGSTSISDCSCPAGLYSLSAIADGGTCVQCEVMKSALSPMMFAHTRTHSRAHTRTHARAHTHTHTHTHTRTH